MAKFKISTVFDAVNKMTAPIKKMKGQVQGFSSFTRGQFKKIGKKAGGMGAALKSGLALGAAALSIGLLTSQISKTISLGHEFEQTYTNAFAKFKDRGMEGAAGLKELSEAAKDVGARTEFSAVEAAGGLEFLAMAGFSTTQAIASLNGVVDLATATNMDLARATDIASDALGAFNLMTDDAAQLQMNLSRVNDVLAKTTTTVNTDLESLFEAVTFGGPAFTAAGQSIETFSAIAGRMASNSIKGSKAGTALRAGILRLSDPTAKVNQGLKTLNTKVLDNSGNMRNMIDILADIEKGSEGMADGAKNAALSQIFGKNAFSAYAAILNEGIGQTKELKKVLDGASGATAEMAAIMRGTGASSVKIMNSVIDAMRLEIFDQMSEDTGALVKEITAAVASFTDWLKETKAVSKIMNVLSTGLKIIVGTIKTVSRVVEFMNDLFGKGWLLVVIGVVLWVYKLAIAMKIITVAMAIFNAVVSANPISLIVIGIAALILAVMALVKHWDKVVNAFKTGINYIWDLFNKLMDNPFVVGAMLLFAPMIAIPLLIAKNWEKVGETISAVWDKVGGIVGKVGEFFGFGGGEDSEGDSGAVPLSANAGLMQGINKSVEEKKSVLDVNFNNAPANTEFEQSGTAPGLSLNLGGI